MLVFGNKGKGCVYINIKDIHNIMKNGSGECTIVIDGQSTVGDRGFIICAGQNQGPWDPKSEEQKHVWEVDETVLAKALVKTLWAMNPTKTMKAKPHGKKILKKKR